MEKNYYPLRIGRHSTIISDKNPYVSYNANEFEKHNGYVIAENVYTQVAQQIIEAYNEKYAPKETYQAEGEAYMDIDSPSGTKVTVSEQSIRNGSDTYKIRANQHLKVGGVYTVDRTEIHNWYTEVILYEFPGVRFSSVQFVKPKDIIHIPSIDYQIDWLKKQLCEKELGDTQDIFIAIKENLQAIKRWKESPVMKDVDCEKVIEDLLTIVKEYSPHRGPTEYMYRSEIQNAEACLGMLQAFKSERGVKVPYVSKESTQFQHKPPGWVEKHSQVTTKSIFEIHANERQMLVDEISKMLPHGQDRSFGFTPNHVAIANAIVFAIERYEKLKSKYNA